MTEREKTLIDALLEDHKEEGPPTEFTATIAPGMRAKIDEPGVMDSGANVSVTNPLTVDKFNLVPQRWERPFHIIFGNGARFHCTHYAHFGPILGQVAIVKGAPDTLSLQSHCARIRSQVPPQRPRRRHLQESETALSLPTARTVPSIPHRHPVPD